MSTLDRSIFKAYDIRGIVDRNLGPDVVRSIGLAVGARIRAAGGTEAVGGRDGRLSGPLLAGALGGGEGDAGGGGGECLPRSAADCAKCR